MNSTISAETKAEPCTANAEQSNNNNKHKESLWEQFGSWFEQLFIGTNSSSKKNIVKQIPCPTSFKLITVNQQAITVSPTTSPTTTEAPAAIHTGLIRIMPLGDSITDGAIIPGGYRIALWNDLQADGDHVDFVGSLFGGPVGDGDHEGHIGWTIPMLAGSVGSWVSTYQPDIILLNIGTNDVDHGDSAANMTANLSRLLGNIYAAKPNTYVILSTLIPTSHGDPNTWSSFNASIPGVAAAYGGHKIVVLDMSHTLGLSDLADGLHPNMAGYNKMASLWYPVVTTIYKEYTRSH